MTDIKTKTIQLTVEQASALEGILRCLPLSLEGFRQLITNNCQESLVCNGIEGADYETYYHSLFFRGLNSDNYHEVTENLADELELDEPTPPYYPRLIKEN